MKEITIYTDGACSGNPGPGGWAAVLTYGTNTLRISGYDPATTNNRMEMQAAISALSRLKEPCRVTIHSDSSYLIDAFNKNWLKAWRARGWKKRDSSDVLNQDLWQKLVALSEVHQITWVKVKGHSDDEMNNLCDKMAVSEITQHKNPEDNG